MSEKVLTADEVAAMRTQATASWRIITKSDTYRHNDVPSLARNTPQNVARIETLGASHEALRAERDRLAGQVAALRSALEDCAGGCVWWPGEDTPRYCIQHSEREPCPHTEALAVLADTETAAREHDQRLRLEGYEQAQAKAEDAAIIAEGITLGKQEADHGSR